MTTTGQPTTIDGVTVEPGLWVWDYNIHRTQVANAETVLGQPTGWWTMTDGCLMDGSRMWTWLPRQGDARTARADVGFTTQADAQRAAREAIWGTVPFAKRACVRPEPGQYGIYVSANVNGHLVVFAFDNYGRRTGKPLRTTH